MSENENELPQDEEPTETGFKHVWPQWKDIASRFSQPDIAKQIEDELARAARLPADMFMIDDKSSRQRSHRISLTPRQGPPYQQTGMLIPQPIDLWPRLPSFTFRVDSLIEEPESLPSDVILDDLGMLLLSKIVEWQGEDTGDLLVARVRSDEERETGQRLKRDLVDCLIHLIRYPDALVQRTEGNFVLSQYAIKRADGLTLWREERLTVWESLFVHRVIFEYRKATVN